VRRCGPAAARQPLPLLARLEGTAAHRIRPGQCPHQACAPAVLLRRPEAMRPARVLASLALGCLTSASGQRNQSLNSMEPLTRCATQPSAADVQAAVEAAISVGQRSYAVPLAAAPYCFGNSSLLVEKAHGLELDLGSNAYLFSVGAGVLVRDSTAVTLRGAGAGAPASISYDPPTSAQGVIASTWASSSKTMLARVQLDPRFPTVVPPGGQCLLWGPGDELHPHFGSCKQIKCGDGGPPGGLCIETPQYGYTNGSAIAFPLYRSGFTIDLVNASNCTVSDVHILSASFMAITEFAGDGSNLYRRVRVGWTPGQPYTPFVRNGLVPQPRLSANADVFHSYGTRRGPRLTNCTFEMAADE
jgi:hypothetical protein